MPRLSVLSPLVYVDSDVYLDLLMRNETPHADNGEPRWRIAKTLFDAVNADQVRLASSALVEAEVCCNGEARRDSERIRDLLRGWFTAPGTAWTDIDRYLARQAVDVMNKHRGQALGPKKIGSADALHLAAAVRLGCDFFMTHDTGYPHGQSVHTVQVLRPQVVWPETLWGAGEATG